MNPTLMKAVKQVIAEEYTEKVILAVDVLLEKFMGEVDTVSSTFDVPRDELVTCFMETLDLINTAHALDEAINTLDIQL